MEEHMKDYKYRTTIVPQWQYYLQDGEYILYIKDKKVGSISIYGYKSDLCSNLDFDCSHFIQTISDFEKLRGEFSLENNGNYIPVREWGLRLEEIQKQENNIMFI